MKAESYMLCTHLSYWANPHLWAWLQAAWTSSQVCTSHPCAGTSPSPSTAVLSSFQGVQATPEKHSPNNHKHQTSATKITFVRETSCAPGTRGKKLSFEATSFGKHWKWQQGILLWVKRKAYVLRDVSVYSSCNTISLTKDLLFLTKTTSSSMGTSVLPKFYGRYHSSSMESDCHSMSRNSRLSCTREILTQS